MNSKPGSKQLPAGSCASVRLKSVHWRIPFAAALPATRECTRSDSRTSVIQSRCFVACICLRSFLYAGDLDLVTCPSNEVLHISPPLSHSLPTTCTSCCTVLQISPLIAIPSLHVHARVHASSGTIVNHSCNNIVSSRDHERSL